MSLPSFNSAIFSNLQANSYTVVTASESFLGGGTWNTSGLLGVDTRISTAVVKAAESIWDKFNNGTSYKNITARECFDSFGTQYVSQFGDVLLIQDTTVWHNPVTWTTVWINETFFEWSDDFTIALNGTVYRNNATALQLLSQSGDVASHANGGDMFPFASTPGLYPSNGWRYSLETFSFLGTSLLIPIDAPLATCPRVT
jgi:hypothetical protein